MELFLIYLWLKLDAFIFLFIVCAVLLGMAALASIWAWALARDDLKYPSLYNLKDTEAKIAHWAKWPKPFIISSLLCSIMSIVIPSSKDVAILVGSSIAIDLARSPEGQKIGALIRGKANEFLDTEIRKLSQPKGN